MLPATLQFLIVMIASAINDRLQRKLDYVEEERRVLRERLDAATGGKKLFFTANQRRRLAEAGKLLTPEECRKCCLMVKPATILAWFGQIAAAVNIGPRQDTLDGMRTTCRNALGLLVVIGAASACGGGTGFAGRQSLPAPANAYYSSLTSIWAFSAEDVWAVGDRVLHFDGQKWTVLTGPGSGSIAFGALWGLAPDDLWATAGSQIFRWRGQSTGWVELVHGIANAPEFSAVWALAADDFAAGGGVVNWEIVRSRGGAITRAYTYGATTGIWGAGSDDVWAAAEDGGFWHWNGSTWSNVEPATGGGGYPQSIWGFSGNDVWAAGEWGTLEHWDGVVWTAPTLDEVNLRAVWGAASDDMWAVGEEGAIWHFDGKSWSAHGSAGPAIFFTGLSGSGPDSVWAVGYELSTAGNHGVVYRVK